MSKWTMWAHFRHLCPRAFQWYKERHKPSSFDPWNCSLKFGKSIEIPSPKVGIALGMWVFTPSHSFTLSHIPRSMWCDSRASFWPAPLWPLYLDSRASSCPAPLRPLCLDYRASSWPATLQFLCLGREPKARVATKLLNELTNNVESNFDSVNPLYP
jgi:hypothetical protein